MKFLLGLFAGIAVTAISIFGYPVVVRSLAPLTTISPVTSSQEKPLDAFSIMNLSSRNFTGSPIGIDEQIETTSEYSVNTFHFVSDRKKVTGVAHIPAGKGPFPVIVQFRGYVDPTKYTPGMGTMHSAEVFAKNGYISLAPDFLGYAGSDALTDDIFLDRFETYTTALNLLASVQTFPRADASHIGIWGHSNGGQIALTINEILHKPIPTVLWAPVSKPFPYSILYYTDDADDHGKYLRKELSRFETEYDVEKYSLTNYLDMIQSPLQIHQGTADNAVPVSWTTTLVDTLTSKDKDVSYFAYIGADHDMNGSWDRVMLRTVEFFKKYLQ